MNKKILIAEDSSVIQNLTKKILGVQNFAAQTVKNGQEVLDIIEKESFDLVLLDINMPVMDGIKCAKAIRTHANDKINRLPIIAITGNALNYTKEDYAAVGINDLLTKPLNYDVMVNMINKYLSA